MARDPYEDYGRREVVARPQHITTAAVPDGVVIKPDRASDADRDRVARHIDANMAAGRLDPEQADIRRSHALTAETRHHLAALTSDLPPLPGPKYDGKSVRQRLASNSPWNVVGCLLAAVVSLTMVIVPWIVVGLAHRPAAAAYMLAVFVSLAGAAGIAATLIWADNAFGWS